MSRDNYFMEIKQLCNGNNYFCLNMYPSIGLAKILLNQYTYIWISDRPCIHKKNLSSKYIYWIMMLYKLYSEMIKLISVLVYLVYKHKFIYSCD